MNLTEFLIQAVASLIAIITFLIVLNVQRSMLIPGGILGMGIWLLYYILKGPTNVIVATFIAAIVGSCISQILSIILKTPVVVFMLSIVMPFVPGIAMTNAVRDLMNNHLNSGMSKLFETLLITLALGAGTTVALVLMK